MSSYFIGFITGATMVVVPDFVAEFDNHWSLRVILIVVISVIVATLDRFYGV